MVKITRPKVADVFARKRLFHAIGQSQSKKPILWLCGPGGSGKTTLVSSYIQSANLPCLWYQIDERDGDPASFFSCMGQAARKARPGSRKLMPLFTPEYHRGVTAFSRNYFEELFRRLKPPFVIVFDNYQTAPDESDLHEALAAGLDALPEGISLIVISRSGPHPQFARLRANGFIEQMGWNEIRFTPEELKEVIRRQLTDRERDLLRDDTVARLHARTDGWIAGIILMLETILATGTDAALDGEDTAASTFDYFANELLKGTREEVRRLLLKTAFLPMVSADIASALTGVENAGRILEELAHKHYFIARHPEKKTAYQYHDLFKDFLRHHAKVCFPADELTQLKKDTAKLLADAGLTADAADLFIDTGDWDALIELVHSQAQLLVRQGRYAVLEKWIDAFPPELLETTPWLLYWKGICCLSFRPLQGQDYFEKAFQHFEAVKDAAGVFLAASGVVECIFYAFEDMQQLDFWIERIPALVREFGGFPSEEIEVRVGAVMCHALSPRQPAHPDFKSWEERALRDPDADSKMRTLSSLGAHYFWRGYMAESLPVRNEFDRLAQASNHLSLGMIAMTMFMGIFHDLSGYRVNSMQEGLRIAEKSGIHILDLLLLLFGTVFALNQGDMESARSSIQRLTSHESDLKGWHRCFYDFVQGYEAYCSGDLRKARVHAEASVQGIKRVGVPESTVFYLNLAAAVLHELKEDETAHKLLAESESISRKIQGIVGRYEFLLLKAQFAMDRGRNEELLSRLREAMVIGRERDIFGVYGAVPPPVMARLAATALDNGIEIDYVQELIRRRKLSPAEPPLQVETWPWPLKIYTLGDFRIERDGKPLVFEGKVPWKPLAVLKAIIASGEKGIPEWKLAELLWSNAEGDTARNALNMALMRLRRLLGNGDAVRVKEKQVMLDPRLCWVDAWTFERMAEAEENTSSPHDLRSMELIKKALALYKGEFLPADAEQGWTASVRERLHHKQLSLTHTLARYDKQSNQIAKAAAH